MNRTSCAPYIAPRDWHPIFEVEPDADDSADDDVEEATIRIDVSGLLLGCQHDAGTTCRACERDVEP